MTSRQQFEEERTREHDLGALDQQQHDEQKRGVMGSMLKAVQGTYESAKEAVVGKRDSAVSDTTTTEVVHVVDDDDNAGLTGEVRDISANKFSGVYDSATDKANRAGSKVGEYTDYATQKAQETKDATKQKAGEYADYAGQKAKETKDSTMEKAKEAKDRTIDKAGEYKDKAAEKAKEGKDATMNKMGEYKDYTAEKAKEGKDNTTGKLGEMKDFATDAAKRAMGYLGGKKEETKQKTAETTDAAKQKTSEAMDKTKEKLSGADEEARRKMEGMKVQDKGYRGESAERGGKVEIKVEETPTGAVAEALKAADQMTGQTFNDVGRLDDEGVTHAGLLERK